MAKLKNGQTLRKVSPEKTTVKAKQRVDWGHKRAAIEVLFPGSEPYETPATLGRDGVILHGARGFQIDDVSGRAAVAQFRRPAGTPSFFEVFGKDKPSARSLGENVLVLRAWMHLNGHPPIPEAEPMTTFATLIGRLVLPRRAWPLFRRGETRSASAFIAEWADKLYPEVGSGKTAKAQRMLPGWALPDRAAFYTQQSIAHERRIGGVQ